MRPDDEVEDHRVPVDDGILEAQTIGDGEPVLVIPTALNPYELQLLARRVAATGRYRVITYRRRGSGTSSPAQEPASIEAEAEDAAAVLAELGIRRAHVIGASYSGAIALALALAHPKVVHTLTVHEPPPTFTSAAEDFRDTGRDLLDRRDREGTRAALDHFYRQFDGPQWRQVLDGLAPGSSAVIEAEADLFFDHDIPALRRWSFDREQADRIRHPTLVLGGTASGPWFTEVRTLLAQWLPRSQVATVEGGDHSMVLHHAAEVAEAVLGHLDDHPMLPERANGTDRSASTPLEDYALLSDLHTGPLISRDGSIDWLCFPRFDSPAVFSALLGTPEDGRWKLSAVDGEVVARRYLPRTFVLETTWQTPTGTAVVTDFLPSSDRQADVIRRVRCTEGQVQVEHDLRIRFDYNRAKPWTRKVDLPHAEQGLLSVAGPNSLLLVGPMLHPHQEQEAQGHADDYQGGVGDRFVGTFDLADGDHLDWVLSWHPSHRFPPVPVDAENALARTIAYWRAWSANVQVHDRDDELVLRSLMVLRALTHAETGGIVAAATTSLPEEFGGVRNWDYRYAWLRDAALTIETLIQHDFVDGARHWRNWLLRAVAGDPDDLQIMYGVAGEREMPEFELPHLAGYEGSRPVRIGNGAATQYQSDVVGEVMLALSALREAEVEDDEWSWGLQKNLLRFVEHNWDTGSHGIWEMRGEPATFVHGQVMMWAALNEGVRAVEQHGLDGPAEHWRTLRDRLHEDIWTHGFDAGRNTFTQTYTTTEVDASLLQLPHTGFIAYDDPRMLGTIARIETDLMDEHGLLRRYRTEAGLDGIAGDEYPFLICSFWLVEQYARSARLDDARALLERLIGVATDLGLYSEEYDPVSGRLAGNFPQAFSHLGFIRAVDAVEEALGKERLSERDRRPAED